MPLDVRIEQLYSIPEIAEMIGENPQNIQKIFGGERRMGGTYYKFSPNSAHGRFRIPEREVNRFRAMRGKAPLNTRIPDKPSYTPIEVAKILGISKQHIYNFLRAGEVKSFTEEWIAIPYLELKRWYGESLIGDMENRPHRVEEAAEQIGVPKEELEQLIINEQIQATPHSRTAIGREDFLEWLERTQGEVVDMTGTRRAG